MGLDWEIMCGERRWTGTHFSRFRIDRMRFPTASAARDYIGRHLGTPCITKPIRWQDTRGGGKLGDRLEMIARIRAERKAAKNG